MTASIAREQIRRGTAKGPYFRENFAQGGIDLSQILPELVTNADAAIATTGRAIRRAPTAEISRLEVEVLHPAA